MILLLTQKETAKRSEILWLGAIENQKEKVRTYSHFAGMPEVRNENQEKNQNNTIRKMFLFASKKLLVQATAVPTVIRRCPANICVLSFSTSGNAAAKPVDAPTTPATPKKVPKKPVAKPINKVTTGNTATSRYAAKRFDTDLRKAIKNPGEYLEYLKEKHKRVRVFVELLSSPFI
jgi:hypothetical protein